MANGWELLQIGEYSRAAKWYRNACRTLDDEPNRFGLALASLACEQLAEAELAVTRLIERDPAGSSQYYDLAGIVQWKLDNPRRAVELWKHGPECAYSDSSRGVQSILLLAFAAAARSDILPFDTACQLLVDQFRKSRTGHWPAPVAKFVLGQIDVEQLETRARTDPEWLHPHHSAQIAFYSGVLKYAAGESDVAGSLVAQCAALRDVTQIPEVFLARDWGRRLGGAPPKPTRSSGPKSRKRSG
jgi:hypothetical protein